MASKLRESVVVITGASSGIGRVTALEFAKHGSRIVLAARREQALNEVAHICERMGGHAVAAPTDVTDESAVKELASRAHQEYGKIDAWVNGAAVTLFGRFEETPSEAYRRVIETNLMGSVNGARAVMPFFREQGAGTLVNISSMLATAPSPYMNPYVTAKYAIRGFSSALREEVAGDHINVCTILPATMDTPLYQQGANYMGRAARAFPPVYDPEEVARAIVSCVEKPRREVYVGGAARVASLLNAVAPGMYERSLRKAASNGQFSNDPSVPSEGNLFEPIPQFAMARGGWQGSEISGGLMRWTLRTVLAASAVAGGLWALYRMRQDEGQCLLSRFGDGGKAARSQRNGMEQADNVPGHTAALNGHRQTARERQASASAEVVT